MTGWVVVKMIAKASATATTKATATAMAMAMATETNAIVANWLVWTSLLVDGG
jgi:hypothetical protein